MNRLLKFRGEKSANDSQFDKTRVWRIYNRHIYKISVTKTGSQVESLLLVRLAVIQIFEKCDHVLAALVRDFSLPEGRKFYVIADSYLAMYHAHISSLAVFWGKLPLACAEKFLLLRQVDEIKRGQFLLDELLPAPLHLV